MTETPLATSTESEPLDRAGSKTDDERPLLWSSAEAVNQVEVALRTCSLNAIALLSKQPTPNNLSPVVINHGSLQDSSPDRSQLLLIRPGPDEPKTRLEMMLIANAPVESRPVSALLAHNAIALATPLTDSSGFNSNPRYTVRAGYMFKLGLYESKYNLARARWAHFPGLIGLSEHEHFPPYFSRDGVCFVKVFHCKPFGKNVAIFAMSICSNQPSVLPVYIVVRWIGPDFVLGNFVSPIIPHAPVDKTVKRTSRKKTKEKEQQPTSDTAESSSVVPVTSVLTIDVANGQLKPHESTAKTLPESAKDTRPSSNGSSPPSMMPTTVLQLPASPPALTPSPATPSSSLTFSPGKSSLTSSSSAAAVSTLATVSKEMTSLMKPPPNKVMKPIVPAKTEGSTLPVSDPEEAPVVDTTTTTPPAAADMTEPSDTLPLSGESEDTTTTAVAATVSSPPPVDADTNITSPVPMETEPSQPPPITTPSVEPSLPVRSSRSRVQALKPFSSANTLSSPLSTPPVASTPPTGTPPLPSTATAVSSTLTRTRSDGKGKAGKASNRMAAQQQSNPMAMLTQVPTWISEDIGLQPLQSLIATLNESNSAREALTPVQTDRITRLFEARGLEARHLNVALRMVQFDSVEWKQIKRVATEAQKDLIDFVKDMRRRLQNARVQQLSRRRMRARNKTAQILSLNDEDSPFEADDIPFQPTASATATSTTSSSTASASTAATTASTVADVITEKRAETTEDFFFFVNKMTTSNRGSPTPSSPRDHVTSLKRSHDEIGDDVISNIEDTKSSKKEDASDSVTSSSNAWPRELTIEALIPKLSKPFTRAAAQQHLQEQLAAGQVSSAVIETLRRAAICGVTSIAEILLRSGHLGDVDAIIMAATETGSEDTVSILLNAAKFDRLDELLKHAVMTGQASIVTRCLEEDVQVTHELLLIAVVSADGDVIDALAKHACRDDLNTTFVAAMALGHMTIVEQLVLLGAGFSIEEYIPFSPLLIAVNHRNGQMVRRCLENGAKPRQNDDGPLRAAIVANAVDIARDLLASGADATGCAGAALRLAARHGQLDVIKLLMTQPKKFTSTQVDCALLEAIRCNNIDAATFLLQHTEDAAFLHARLEQEYQFDQSELLAKLMADERPQTTARKSRQLMRTNSLDALALVAAKLVDPPQSSSSDVINQTNASSGFDDLLRASKSFVPANKAISDALDNDPNMVVNLTVFNIGSFDKRAAMTILCEQELPTAAMTNELGSRLDNLIALGVITDTSKPNAASLKWDESAFRIATEERGRSNYYHNNYEHALYRYYKYYMALLEKAFKLWNEGGESRVQGQQIVNYDRDQFKNIAKGHKDLPMPYVGLVCKALSETGLFADLLKQRVITDVVRFFLTVRSKMDTTSQTVPYGPMTRSGRPPKRNSASQPASSSKTTRAKQLRLSVPDSAGHSPIASPVVASPSAITNQGHGGSPTETDASGTESATKDDDSFYLYQIDDAILKRACAIVKEVVPETVMIEDESADLIRDIILTHLQATPTHAKTLISSVFSPSHPLHEMAIQLIRSPELIHLASSRYAICLVFYVLELSSQTYRRIITEIKQLHPSIFPLIDIVNKLRRRASNRLQARQSRARRGLSYSGSLEKGTGFDSDDETQSAMNDTVSSSRSNLVTV